MSVRPPIQVVGPSRRTAAGRPVIARVAVAALTAVLVGCGGNVRIPPSGTPSAEPPAPGIDGLLVASGGPLRVTDPAGNLVAFDGPDQPVLRVTAASGRVIAIGADGMAVRADG